jgi:hypothetical protein
LKKNRISKNWINKQKRDIYVRQSQVDGYRARSAYKLIEIDEKFKILKNGISVIDLGASPGSWSQYIVRTVKSGNIFGSEGLAINMSVYIDELETEFLPLNCNWIASNLLPKFDEIKDTFVEPNLPNYEIGIMHLAAGIWDDDKDMRLNKEVRIKIQSVQKNVLSKSLRFGH